VSLSAFDVLIVGAGQAGAQCAISLRQGGLAGSVALVGDEPEPPYERPPLSKDYLAGDKPFERMLLRPETFWAEGDVARSLYRRGRCGGACRDDRPRRGVRLGQADLGGGRKPSRPACPRRGSCGRPRRPHPRRR